ncbi:hypothetical protein [Sorangium atrum]|uniref:hypothetical protein n=1 Tax=Sorangium atrum TaxID=2995308 RepID=UPI0027D93DBA|nr:hypothetical protein [Sorangium aterium]
MVAAYTRIARAAGAGHDARRDLAELRPEHHEILLAIDSPESLVQYAKRRGTNPHSAASRLRLAREAP